MNYSDIFSLSDMQKTIFVVDDESDIRESIKTILETKDYNVITLENGDEITVTFNVPTAAGAYVVQHNSQIGCRYLLHNTFFPVNGCTTPTESTDDHIDQWAVHSLTHNVGENDSTRSNQWTSDDQDIVVDEALVEEDPARARQEAKRKGTITRVVDVDGTETKKEYDFEV